MIFKYEGDGIKVPIGELSRPDTGNTELVVKLEVSDPDNQWGNRIRLLLFLDREL